MRFRYVEATSGEVLRKEPGAAPGLLLVSPYYNAAGPVVLLDEQLREVKRVNTVGGLAPAKPTPAGRQPATVAAR